MVKYFLIGKTNFLSSLNAWLRPQSTPEVCTVRRFLLFRQHVAGALIIQNKSVHLVTRELITYH